MTLAPGARVGAYQVLSAIGAGGMGEVWRATDTRLDRDVALKVLPADFGADADRVARFTREAKVLASLNHPSIASVYGFEQIDGQGVLAMELVGGEGLDERIARGAIPLDEALPIALQIAEALEAAHEKGIVHRDLKPANVKLTADGKVKLLDFGLAKALEGSAAERSGPDLTQSPTLTARATQAGVILGTAAYMSPEQARGRPVDRRADIWAFGVVFFEMLTGKRLFEGETVSDVLASILKSAPDFSTLPAGLPTAVVRVLRQCLQKDPKLRLHDIADSRIELAETAEEPARPAPVAGRGHGVAIAWTIAGLLLAALVGLALARSRPEAARKMVRFVLTPPPGGSFASWPALTPDGATLLYSVQSANGSSALWTRRLDSEGATPLPVEAPSYRFPFWSPDGRSVAYGSAEKLMRFDLAGSRPQTLCSASQMFHGSWGTQGDILFVPFYGAGIHRVSSGGGAPVPVTAVDGARGEAAHLNPRFLPDGRRFLFFARLKHAGQDREGWICAGSLDAKETKRIRQADAFVGTCGGGLLFANEGTLLVQAFDERSLTTSGEPVAIPGRVVHEGDTATANVSVARDGTLAFRSDPPRLRQLVLVDRAGNKLKSIGAPGEFVEPFRLSPDGGRVAIGRIDERTALTNLWLVDVDGGAGVRLTSGRQEERHPVFSPDGTGLAFSTDTEGPYDLVLRSLAGSAPDRPLVATPFDKLAFGWTRDGGLFYVSNEPKEATFWLLSTEKGANPQSLGVAPPDADAAISPDGQWLVYASSETGQSEVYVRAAAAGGAKARVSLEGGRHPRWRGDGKEIFFVGKDSTLMAVPWVPGATGRHLPAPLFTVSLPALQYAPFDASNDGQRFLLLRPVESATRTEITVVVNGVPPAPR